NLKTLKTPSKVVDLCFNKDDSLIFVLMKRNQFLAISTKDFKATNYFLKYKNRIKSILHNFQQFSKLQLSPNNKDGFFAYNDKMIVKIDMSKFPPPPPTKLNFSQTNLSQKFEPIFEEKNLINGVKRKNGEYFNDESSNLFSENDDGSFDMDNFQIERNFKPVYFTALNDFERIVVEQDAVALSKDLPSTLYKHKYGTGI
ncbi:hypothetical protein MHBO_003256, partial [Bonamia ostreae]